MKDLKMIVGKNKLEFFDKDFMDKITKMENPLEFYYKFYENLPQNMLHYYKELKCASALQVAHYIAHPVTLYPNFQIVDGFQNFGASVFEGHTESITSSQTERDFVRVNRVHFTVVNVNADIAGIGSIGYTHPTTFHRPHQRKIHHHSIFLVQRFGLLK